MTSAPPPVPTAVAEGFTVPMSNQAEVTLDRSPDSSGNANGFLGSLGKWRRAVGLCLLLITVILWTASNFLASTIFADDTYSKPYFVTYVNTSFFIVPLIPIMIRKAITHPEEFHGIRDQWRARFRYSALKQEDEGSIKGDSPRVHLRRQSASASQELLLGDPMLSSQTMSTTGKTTRALSLQEIARLSLEFCILWFLANYFVAACLEYTTVASSTILTSTSSVFTLLFGSLFGVEKFTVRKLLGVLASLAGIILISSMDFTGNHDEHRGDFPHKSRKELVLGDMLAFLSAVLYGLYAVFMKKRIGDESRVNMPIFFGLVGLINVILLWPGFLILHFTGAETFELPPGGKVLTIILVNSISSLVSDIAWAYAVLLTSPIVVTVGLSMTIPLSLVGQMVLNSQTASPLYWVGACTVVVSFLFVNHESKDESSADESVAHDENNIISP